ncbi:MAG: DNA translocase FtsK [Candidatus Firestonebacteria bacterium]
MSKKHELIGILWFVLSIFLMISLLSFSGGNYLGLIGKYVQSVFLYLFGLSSYLFPFIFGVIGYFTFVDKKFEKPHFKIIGSSLFIIALCLLFYLLGLSNSESNMLGFLIGLGVIKTTSRLGGYIFCVITFVLSIYFLEFEEIFKNLLSNIIQILKQKFNKPVKIEDKIQKKDEHKEEIKPRKLQKKDIKKEIKEEKPSLGTPLVSPASSGAWVKYELPLMDLLNNIPTTVSFKEDLRANEETIKKTLKNFGIDVEISRTVKGPVVTRYEIKPAPGTKINKIVSLSNDLALVLKATHIRIIAPIPGESAVGIEIPNKKYSLVTLKEVIQSDRFANFKGVLPVSVGKSVDGEVLVYDLAEMPHLLVAGATGSGKSVCLSTIIISLLYKFTPYELKLLLIDPKRVELSLYKDLPHLYSPVINDAKKATDALKLLNKDMQDRYNKLSQVNARDIISYNKVAKEKLPYIVVVIDELADLMLVSAREIEEAITRLAQMARGVGIHLIFATQRPSVDIITGVIKANFPSRIALQVFSKVDSRVILDTGGAEDLLGKGDMLMYLAGFPKPVRAQGAYVCESEVKKIINFWNGQGKPIYYGPDEKENISLSDTEEMDELFKKALILIKERKRASATLIQGALHISGGNASNLISIMETKGLISPSTGSKSREIYFDKIDELLDKFDKK